MCMYWGWAVCWYKGQNITWKPALLLFCIKITNTYYTTSKHCTTKFLNSKYEQTKYQPYQRAKYLPICQTHFSNQLMMELSKANAIFCFAYLCHCTVSVISMRLSARPDNSRLPADRLCWHRRCRFHIWYNKKVMEFGNDMIWDLQIFRLRFL